VRVNAIAPGLIQTALSEYYWKDEAQKEKVIARQPIQRIGQPRDVAELALLLASGRGSYITGQTLTVDGGFLLPGL
jgi:NAD(P)-dependent dehydrogenase (short-subunit alcohol dehydrogenase family)